MKRHMLKAGNIFTESNITYVFNIFNWLFNILLLTICNKLYQGFSAGMPCIKKRVDPSTRSLGLAGPDNLFLRLFSLRSCHTGSTWNCRKQNFRMSLTKSRLGNMKIESAHISLQMYSISQSAFHCSCFNLLFIYYITILLKYLTLIF
jgi:hypothetical protein